MNESLSVSKYLGLGLGARSLLLLLLLLFVDYLAKEKKKS